MVPLCLHHALYTQPFIEVTVEYMQWLETRNIWQNAAVRTVFYTMSAPIRWLRSGLGTQRMKVSQEPRGGQEDAGQR